MRRYYWVDNTDNQGFYDVVKIIAAVYKVTIFEVNTPDKNVKEMQMVRKDKMLDQLKLLGNITGNNIKWMLPTIKNGSYY